MVRLFCVKEQEICRNVPFTAAMRSPPFPVLELKRMARGHFAAKSAQQQPVVPHLRIFCKKQKSGVDKPAEPCIISIVVSSTQRDCVRVAQQTLTLYVRVRILLPLPKEISLNCNGSERFFFVFKELENSGTKKITVGGSTSKRKNNTIQVKRQISKWTNRGISKQSEKSLKRSIESRERQIRHHRKKLQNPSQFDKGWGEKTEQQRTGLLKHWEKEIKNFERNIGQAKTELEKRGENDE